MLFKPLVRSVVSRDGSLNGLRQRPVERAQREKDSEAEDQAGPVEGAAASREGAHGGQQSCRGSCCQANEGRTFREKPLGIRMEGLFSYISDSVGPNLGKNIKVSSASKITIVAMVKMWKTCW